MSFQEDDFGYNDWKAEVKRFYCQFHNSFRLLENWRLARPQISPVQCEYARRLVLSMIEAADALAEVWGEKWEIAARDLREFLNRPPPKSPNLPPVLGGSFLRERLSHYFALFC